MYLYKFFLFHVKCDSNYLKCSFKMLYHKIALFYSIQGLSQIIKDITV